MLAAALDRREVVQRAFAPRPGIVVAGNGMVGHHLCMRLAEAGLARSSSVVVFAEEASPAYDRIHLVERLGGRTRESLALASREGYAGRGLELRLGDPIVAIDRERRRVRSASGFEVDYETLVLATGSHPFRPPIEGTDGEAVRLYRTLEDVEEIGRRARDAETAVVVGGGLLGLEAARALLDLGLATTIVEAADGLLCRQLDPEASLVLRRRIERLGVHVRVGARLTRITTVGGGCRVELADGGSVEADLVVVAAGIRPRDELARDAGLALGPNGGVLVDARLRSSDPAILAIGECAAPRGRVYGLAAPGYRMAEVVAANLAGGRARFEGGEFSTTLKVFGAEVSVLGENLAHGTWVRHGSGDELRQIVTRDGRLVGATIVGDAAGARRLQAGIDRHAFVWPWQARRFRRCGVIWPDEDDEPVASWPAARVVCHCARVTRAACASAITAGAADVDGLGRTTGAGTLCGSCRPLLAELVGAGAVVAEPAERGLVGASIAALTLAIAVATLAPVPFAESVAAGASVDVLWRSGLARQVTGWTLFVLTLLAGGLLARRRLRALDRLGRFTSWRLAHAGLGAAALLVLAVHTGLRLGENLNFVLVAAFLATSLLGGAAGGAVGAPRAPRGWRRRLTAIHALVTWPLPALIFFHVVTVYYF